MRVHALPRAFVEIRCCARALESDGRIHLYMFAWQSAAASRN